MNQNIKKLLSFLLLILTVSMLTGCGQKQKECFQKTEVSLDTFVTIQIYDTPSNEEKVNALLSDCMELIKHYENLFSPYIENSDIYKVNHAGGEWVTVDKDTISIIYSALEYCDITGGKIDITILPVKQLWNFQEDSSDIPDANAIQVRLQSVNYESIEIDGVRMRLNDPNAAIDLGFIAKGYISEQVKKLLLENGVDSALINLGGNICVIGQKPDGNDFVVGIKEPFSKKDSYMETVNLSGDHGFQTAVTSGIYERYFQLGDKIYHHVLDTSTGYPVDTDLYSVTILTDSSLHADALSTTCLVLGLEEAKNFISNIKGAEAIFITKDMKIIDTRK